MSPALRKRRRRPQTYTPCDEDIKRVTSRVFKTKGMGWTQWPSVTVLANEFGVQIEDMLVIIKQCRRVRLFKGWWIPAHYNQPTTYIPFSNKPEEWLVEPVI